MEEITHSSQASNLADILEKVLDKGIVIAGDIKINIADVELLTIKVRLIVASVDKAKEIGINWWEEDPYLSTKAKEKEIKEQKEYQKNLEERIKTLEGQNTQNTGNEQKNKEE
ncbi:MAG: gas vesicle protein [Bacteroidales bacterium]|nr:gas vesicle protein [Bacteroidales bacterium]MCF8338277.1 gas vesicle protein [Bacteroidales bacterium]